MALAIQNIKIIRGHGIKATIPNPSTLSEYDEGYKKTDLQLGEWAYNVDDKIYYTRTVSGISLLYDPGYYKTADQIDKYDPTKTYPPGEYVSYQISDEPQMVVSIEITGASGEEANGIIQASASGAGEDYVFYLDGTDRKNTTGYFDGLVIGSYILIVTTPDQKYIETLEFQIPDTGLQIISIQATEIDYYTPGQITCVTEGGSGELTYKLIPTNEVNATGIFNVTEPGAYQVLVNDQILSEIVNIQRNETTNTILEYKAKAQELEMTIFDETNLYSTLNELILSGRIYTDTYFFDKNFAVLLDENSNLVKILSLTKKNGEFIIVEQPDTLRRFNWSENYIDNYAGVGTSTRNIPIPINFGMNSFYFETEIYLQYGAGATYFFSQGSPLNFRIALTTSSRLYPVFYRLDATGATRTVPYQFDSNFHKLRFEIIRIDATNAECKIFVDNVLVDNWFNTWDSPISGEYGMHLLYGNAQSVIRWKYFRIGLL